MRFPLRFCPLLEELLWEAWGLNGHLQDWLHDYDYIDRVMSDDCIARTDNTTGVIKQLLLDMQRFIVAESSIAGVVALI